MVIDFGVAKIFKRKMTKLSERIVDRSGAFTNLFEELAELLGIHSGCP